MRKWLRDRPWIWIVLLLALLFASSVATLVIAHLNRPEIVKPASRAISSTARCRAPTPRGVARQDPL